MTGIVPATKAEVDPSHKGKGLVDHNNLLMVSPEVDSCIDVLGVAENLYNSMYMCVCVYVYVESFYDRICKNTVFFYKIRQFSSQQPYKNDS